MIITTINRTKMLSHISNSNVNNHQNNDICSNCGGHVVIDTTHGVLVCTSCGCVHGQVYV